MAIAEVVRPINIRRALEIPDHRWPFEEELQWLAEQASRHYRIAEVGSFYGRSTVAMAVNALGTVWAYDDWYGPRDSDFSDDQRDGLYDAFLANVRGLDVIPVRGDHALLPPNVTDGPDMVFIDGAHDYLSVHRDIALWKARLIPGGLLCGHDRNEPGVRQALDELLPGWSAVPGHTLLWQWKEAPMPAGLRKMSIDELNLLGTPNAIPAPTPIDSLEWKISAGPGEIPKTFGLGIMIPSISRNGDGSLRFIPPEWGVGFRLLAPLANCRDITLSLKDAPRGPARDTLVKQARSHGCKWGMFLDDDVVPPPDTLQQLQYVLENADDDVALCAGIYTTKTHPAVPLVFQDMGIGPYWRWKRGQVFECRAIATGCMMIRMSIFDSLPEPWFMDVHGIEQAKELGVWDPTNFVHEWTDDMFFCKRVRDAGLRMLAHGGVLCDHWGQDGRVYRMADDSYPMRP